MGNLFSIFLVIVKKSAVSNITLQICIIRTVESFLPPCFNLFFPIYSIVRHSEKTLSQSYYQYSSEKCYIYLSRRMFSVWFHAFKMLGSLSVDKWEPFEKVSYLCWSYFPLRKTRIWRVHWQHQMTSRNCDVTLFAVIIDTCLHEKFLFVCLLLVTSKLFTSCKHIETLQNGKINLHMKQNSAQSS